MPVVQAGTRGIDQDDIPNLQLRVMQALHSHHTRKTVSPGWKLPRDKSRLPGPVPLELGTLAGAVRAGDGGIPQAPWDMGPQWTGQAAVSQRAMAAIARKKMGFNRAGIVKDSGNHSHNGVPESYL